MHNRSAALRRKHSMRCGLLAICVMACPWTGAAWSSAADSQRLVVLPEDIKLEGPEARQTLVVERREGESYRGQVNVPVSFSVADAAVAKVDGGVVIPLANG